MVTSSIFEILLTNMLTRTIAGPSSHLERKKTTASISGRAEKSKAMGHQHPPGGTGPSALTPTYNKQFNAIKKSYEAMYHHITYRRPMLARVAVSTLYPNAWCRRKTLTILMSLIVAMLRTNRFTRTMAGPSGATDKTTCYI